MKLPIPVTGQILNRVAAVDHFRGAWADGAALSERRRREIVGTSRVASTAAACRLAGIRTTEDEVRAWIDGEHPADGRDAAEVLGYHRAIGEPDPPPAPLLDTQTLRRLHAVILGAGDDGDGTPWRNTAAEPEAFDADGRALGRVFMTLPPRLVPETMEDLTTWVEFELRDREHHPLLIVGTFALGILAANPFPRGNLRLALVLATRMLVRSGYSFVRYASIEETLETRREALFEAFDVSQTRLWTGEANLEPWLDFFMDRLEEQSRRVAARVDAERRASRLSPLQRAIVDTVRENGTAEAGLLIRRLGANRNTLKDNLRRLVDRGVLEKMGERRGTRYRIASAQAGRLPEP